MASTPKTVFASASTLGDLFARLPLNQPNQWSEIENTAQSLANDLRVKDVEQQTALGKTLLPQTLTSLLKGAIDGAPIPHRERKPATFEILRVGANLCMDHDDNRDYLLEAGFPQTVVSLLEGYAESIPENLVGHLPLSIQDLKVIRTAIGAVLNGSLGYDPVKTRLISLEAAMTILKLSMAIYPAGSWLKEHDSPMNGDGEDEEAAMIESWTLRAGISNWAWRAISELREDADGENSNTHQLFSPDVLPYLVRTLQAFTPPYPSTPQLRLFATPTPTRRTLAQADFHTLEECCGLLESLALDDEDVRLSLARGLHFPDGEHNGVPCLTDMLTFVDRGDYPSYWSAEERESWSKGFDMCKAAVVKAVVEVAGEAKNTDVLWDDSEAADGKPGGEFVTRMVQWVRTHKNLEATNRDDLVICATLSLGNLVRRDAHSAAIVAPPISLGADLATLLGPETDTKVKHGVLGLLKHLAQFQGNRATLGQAGIIERLVACQIWADKADMVEVVQMSAIGVAKHLCNGNAENTFAFVLPSSSASEDAQSSPAVAPTGLDQILSLIRRSNTTAVKSEGTRVLVNVIKSLWAGDAASLTKEDEAWRERRKDAMKAVATPQVATALAQLIGRSKKYPILINEGIVGLTLLSMHSGGGTLALDALLNPLPSEATSRTQNSKDNNSLSSLTSPIAPSTTDSPIVTGPARALDMLVATLRTPSTHHTPASTSDSSSPSTSQVSSAHHPPALPVPYVPPEIRANVCALVGHLGRPGVVPAERAGDLTTMKEGVREVLEGLCPAKDKEGAGVDAVAAAAKKALDAWN